jgi:YidC/Oxa1 family membrane protein insertase
LILFDGNDNKFGLVLSAGGKNINTNDSVLYAKRCSIIAVADKDSSSITMRLSYSPTQYIDYIYTLKGTGFKLGLTIKPTGLDQVVANSGTTTLTGQPACTNRKKILHRSASTPPFILKIPITRLIT